MQALLAVVAASTAHKHRRHAALRDARIGAQIRNSRLSTRSCSPFIVGYFFPMSDNPIHVAKIAREIKLQPNQVRAVRAFLADGATVPFIARYRKEATGSLDEVQITAIRDRLEQLEELDQRREAIIKSLGERNLLTECFLSGTRSILHPPF